MSNHRDFTQGAVTKQIVSMAMPIMGIAFLQMAYNLVDMFWLGREGSAEMAAVGAAGFFVWFASAIALIPKLGAEVLISQNLGKGYPQLARRYARHSLVLAIVMGLALGISFYGTHRALLQLVGLNSERTYTMACLYSRVVAWGFPCIFIIYSYFGIYNGYGHPRMVFIANGIGLLLNIMLDPLLIRGIAFFPRLGVEGAAYATVISQLVVVLIFLGVHSQKQHPFHALLRGFRLHMGIMQRTLRMGAPSGLQSALFALIGLTLAHFVARWGDIEVAVQNLGAQIEAITWMTASGFATALTSFTGQNYGARNFQRIQKGYRSTLFSLSALALLASGLFIGFGGELFALFSHESEVIAAGAIYMRIVGVSQIFMVLEITTGGLLNGLGKTHMPAIVSIVFNLVRVPLALWWGHYSVQGIWWSIALSSTLKGAILWGWYRATKHTITQ